MNPKTRTFLMLLLLIFVASIATSGCANKGDHFMANQDVKAISDWDSPTIVKPTCDIEAGAEVEVVGFVTLGRASGGETVIQIKAVDNSCLGTVETMIGFTPVKKKK